MRRKALTALLLAVLCVITLTITVNSGRAQWAEFESPNQRDLHLVKSVAQLQDIEPTVTTHCALQPESSKSPSTIARSKQRNLLNSTAPITLERFRQLQPASSAKDENSGEKISAQSVQSARSYVPREEIALIHPTNYGDRFLLDIQGNPTDLTPIVVLHETVGSANGTINFFRTPHPRDEDQASYHILIRQNGTIVYLVPPDKRAFGAGNSVFVGTNGPEAVKTHPSFPASVNNFAYHISLETPPDGYHNSYTHSGYTTSQYQSLAWLVSKTGVPDNRITTHKAVDRSGQRMDPRSFSFSKFFKLLQTQTKTTEIAIRCTPPPDAPQSKAPVKQAKATSINIQGR
ncbi:MAG: N-acetylmuramoyl-L-alanine amidase [Leptolyngbyaceae cyanobacterium RU_5_1]|nr:N-acetylmuramoyl-L-alanine amidase [Leptolyngbyaceae cyanobacterium RU_5_1]